MVGVTFLHLAAEAAIVALSDHNGIATERQHWRKVEAATELHTRGVLSTDLSPILELLNQARKDAGYEGEDPDFGDWTSESLLSAIEDVVKAAEEATSTVQDDDEEAATAADPSEGFDPMTPAGLATQLSVDLGWSARLREDRRRATKLQTPSQRQATETLLQRALALGTEAVALTGSTVRGQRTAVSDLDLMIVGQRPDVGGIREDVDVYAASTKAFWERLLAGDDYIQWTLRFGCILHDDGILQAASRYIQENGLVPSAERKLIQAHRGLGLAWSVLESGDLEAAREQCRAALTTIARWLLLANGEFPLSRDELSDQLLALGCFDLAAALHRLIHDEPSGDELRTGLEVGGKLMNTPPRRAAAPSPITLRRRRQQNARGALSPTSPRASDS